MAATRYRAYAPNGEVLKSGATTGKVTLSSEEKIDKIVFYSGPATKEVVCGSVKVGKSGKIVAELKD
jgi:hypothetical protein